MRGGWNKKSDIFKECIFCGKRFKVLHCRKTMAKYCSSKCYFKSRVGVRISKRTEFKKGETPTGSILFKKGQVPKNKGKGRYGEIGHPYCIDCSVPISYGATRCKSCSRKGHFAQSWLGGKSFEPYGLDFNGGLKEKIRERDGHRCQECFRHQDELYTKPGRKYKLNVHHIDYDKKNNDVGNLISLCRSCHSQTNFKRGDWTEYFRGK